MLRPLRMKHLRLLLLTEDLPRASLILAEMESFHADTRPPEEARLADAPGRGYSELFQTARSRLDKIGKLIPLDEEPQLAEIRVISQRELATVTDGLGEIWSECSRYEERHRRLDDEERLVKEQDASVFRQQSPANLPLKRSNEPRVIIRTPPKQPAAQKNVKDRGEKRDDR